MIGLIKRYPAASMVIVGTCLILSAACWAALLEHGTWRWSIFREHAWLRHNWPAMALVFAFSAVAGALLGICGMTWIVFRHRRRPESGRLD